MKEIDCYVSIGHSVAEHKNRCGNGPTKIFINDAMEICIKKQLKSFYSCKLNEGRATKIMGIPCETYSDRSDTPDFYLAERGTIIERNVTEDGR